MVEKIKYLILITLVTAISACKMGYSFSGASISPEVKTVSVSLFPNYAPLAQPLASQTFTEALRTIFITQTNLSLVDREGDLHFEGSITAYNTTPVALQGGEMSQATLNRLSMTVNVKFINSLDDTKDFESAFTRYTDYDARRNLSDVETLLLKEINDQLVQDIFNKAVVNW
ncbi:MAG: LptE family protein [Bacteroidetes bacterium]|nr:LptE family protein [Bacteroidota bacterium]